MTLRWEPIGRDFVGSKGYSGEAGVAFVREISTGFGETVWVWMLSDEVQPHGQSWRGSCESQSLGRELAEDAWGRWLARAGLMRVDGP